MCNGRRGGLARRGDVTFIALDFDIGSARTEPSVAEAHEALQWIREAFRGAGAWPRIGARLGMLLREAGLASVATFDIQAYLSPQDPAGARLLAGVVRSLAPVIVSRGIATVEQIDAASLEERLAIALERAHAVLLPPTVVGAWGRAPAS